jgi:hypothetical protein
MTGASFGSITEGVLAGGVPQDSFAVCCLCPCSAHDQVERAPLFSRRAP